MSILIVDDSAVARRHLRTLLEDAGHRHILEAASAEAAFALLGDPPGQGAHASRGDQGNQTPIAAARVDRVEGVAGVDGAEGEGVELVLLDVVMPGVDGVEACRRLKASPRLRDLPVIMVTAESEAAHVTAALGAGAADYIEKPVGAVALAARVRAAIALKHETDRRKAREAEVRAQLQRALVAERALARANARLAEQADALTTELARRERAEAALARRAHMDGALLAARTAAHELNNALSPVVGFAELLTTHPAIATDPLAVARLRTIGEAAALAAEKVALLQQATTLENPPLSLAAGAHVLDLARVARYAGA